MALAPGTRIGPYELLSVVGAGGMGEVYKARDTRLDRTVAIKILPESLAADSQFRERFNREARVISHLEDPHICALYDLGEQHGTSFLVMQFLQGETLEARLKKGAIARGEALAVAIQISSALNTAHRAGVIHRDLKPGNIMLTKAGATLLDFGLAKTSQAMPGDSASMLPTTPPEAITAQGSLLGTFQYMAPEQLEGQNADVRSDIFAFGAVLYEMLTGEKAFKGKGQASLIRAIMGTDPGPETLRPFGPAIDRLVRKCLAKEPERRWQNAADLHDELVWLADASEPGSSTLYQPTVGSGAIVRNVKIAWTAAALLLLATLGALALGRVGYLGSANDRSTYVVSIVPPEGVRIPAGADHFALSPDGRSFAFVATDAKDSLNVPQLWVRSLTTGTDQRLLGTEGADSPFWSPDSRFIAFIAQGKLKKIEVASAHVLTLADATFNAPGAWNADDVIVFMARGGDGLYRVPAQGGTAARLTTVDRSTGDQGHAQPTFLPDGRHFIYQAGQIQRTRAFLVGTLDSDEPIASLPSPGSAATFADGYLVFLRKGTLFAQAFDTRHFSLRGDPVVLGEHVATGGIVGTSGAFSVSRTGLLAYQTDAKASTNSQLVWFDRAGKQLQLVGDPGEDGDLELAPDGKRAMVTDPTGTATAARNLWVVDLERSRRSRLTFDEPGEGTAVWSSDGERVIFSSRVGGKGNLDVFRRGPTSAGEPDLLLPGDPSVMPTSWSADGRFVLYREGFENVGSLDVWAFPVGGERKPFPLLTTPFNESQARFSPDGRWVAYVSDETGRDEIYVMPFIPPGGLAGAAESGTGVGKWQVSSTGGTLPRWRHDGRELFFVAPNNMLMSAIVDGTTAHFEIGSVQPMFELHPMLGRGDFYDVSPDGQRFLVNTDLPNEGTVPPPITLVTNWTAALKK